MTAAIRYAKALFALAQESKQQSVVTAAVTALKEAVADASVQAALANPRLQPAQRTKLAETMAKAVKAPVSLSSTLGVLAKANRLSLVSSVLEQYLTLADTSAGITRVRVTAAASLTEAQRTKLTNLVKAHTKATDIRLEETLDPSLQGGFRAFFNGLVWDASLSGSLARLSNRLKSAITQRQN